MNKPMLRIPIVTEYTGKFLFSLLIECLVRLLWFDRSALRLSRLVKCQSLFQCEQNRPPTLVLASSGTETVRRILPSPANEVRRDRVTEKFRHWERAGGPSVRMCISCGSNSRRRYCTRCTRTPLPLLLIRMA